MKLRYNGTVKDGKINIPNRMRIEAAKAFEGKSITVTIERKRTKRSDAQNKYYWGVVLPYLMDGFFDLGNDIPRGGDTIAMLHELMKDKFLDNGIELADAHGELIKTKPTTTELTKEEMTDYIEKIRLWAAEFLNIKIPDAGDTKDLFDV